MQVAEKVSRDPKYPFLGTVSSLLLLVGNSLLITVLYGVSDPRFGSALARRFPYGISVLVTGIFVFVVVCLRPSL
jgi:hypothetical protein